MGVYMAGYSDKRSQFFEHYFSLAKSYDDYLNGGESHYRERWQANARQVSLTKDQLRLLSSFKRKINLLVMSGIWCGDCARQGPILNAFSSAAPVIALRFIDNKANPELQDELRINGAEKVPVIVALSEDFYELARFGDKHLSVYRKKAKSELGPSCEIGLLGPDKGELELEIQEWLDYLERIQIMLRLSPMLRKRYND